MHRVLQDHTETLQDDSVRLDQIERKLDNSIARLDDHRVRLERLEKSRQP